MTKKQIITELSDDALVTRLGALLSAERQCTADVLAHLAELSRRRLYLAAGYSSLYRYAVDHLGMSEGQAGHRITVARLLLRFPQIYELVAAGALHLAGLKLLAPHLTDDNHQALLADASHQSKRAIEELLAARFPTSDVLPLMVAQPTPIMNPVPDEGPKAGRTAPLTSVAVTTSQPATPLSADSFAMTFTIDRACAGKLSQAQALLRHRIPGGDVGAIMSLALDALLTQVRKQRFAATDRPRASSKPTTSSKTKSTKQTKSTKPTKPTKSTKPGTRYIAAEVKRAVVARDGERCAFVADDGHRCTKTSFLEFHHIEPHGKGGVSTAGNLQLLCRAHNAYYACVDYGVDHMARARASSNQTVPAFVARQASSALQTLGFAPRAARQAVKRAVAAQPTPPDETQPVGACTLERLIRQSLRQLSPPTSTGARERRVSYGKRGPWALGAGSGAPCSQRCQRGRG